MIINIFPTEDPGQAIPVGHTIGMGNAISNGSRHEGLPLWVENLMAANKENDIQWTMSYRELYRLHKPDTLKIAARRPRKLPDVDDSTGVVSCIPADPEENGTDLKSRGLVTVWNSHSNTDSSMLVLEQNDHATPPIEVTINLELIASRHLDARSVPRTSSENFVRHRAISERGEDRDKQLFVPGEPDLDDLILLNDPSLDVVTPFPEPSHAPLQIISPMEHYRVFLPSMHNQDVGLTNRELKNPTHSLHPSNQPNSHDRMSNYVKYDQPWVEGSDFYSRDISLQLAVLDSHSHQIQQRRSDFYSQDISEQLAQMSQVNNSSLAYGHSARPDLYFQDQWYINDV
ncbi:hypothetical protein I302_102570 [Kwoniella bestiolae CBS 10118]|uniref:Uncharacterized protein n=1 Tax=Kwoniella bestiolae CBS 10118 TaxID=1296100 RepID=A0A1B9GFB4_9TREE|nr:hypothetical protein I302_01257 [Kwoniella bestiolae CBS 10118]OCF29744.1 hypothetical protein I302_01257 [Kwoniella bestiolae CBS 10118]